MGLEINLTEAPIIMALVHEREIKAKEEGVTIGREEGVEKGKHSLLLKLLEKKFGKLSKTQIAKVQAMKNGDIDDAFLKAYDAETLSDIFSSK